MFLKDDEIDSAIQACSLSKLEMAGAILIIRQEPHFDRIYYGVSDRRSLRRVLDEVPQPEGGVLIADVVGHEKDVSDINEAFERAGFYRRACLRRLRLTIPSSRMIGEAVPDIDLARLADVPAIMQALVNNFDLYSDQLPSVEEVRKAVVGGTILVLRDALNVAGFYYYDRTGLTALSRYWYVFRGSRSRSTDLIRRFFQECREQRRFLLWVREENHLVLGIHKSFGYKPDSMIDTIWMKR